MGQAAVGPGGRACGSAGHNSQCFESSFQVLLVSYKFEGKLLLQRHQLVNACLVEELLYFRAFEQKTLTPEQWAPEWQPLHGYSVLLTRLLLTDCFYLWTIVSSLLFFLHSVTPSSLAFFLLLKLVKLISASGPLPLLLFCLHCSPRFSVVLSFSCLQLK